MSTATAPRMPTVDELCKLDAEVWFRRYGVLKTKKGVPIRRPKPTPVQKKMFDGYRACRAARKPCLMLVLKPRKDGASTGAQAITYHHLRTFGGRNGAQMGDKIGTSANLFEMFRTFAEMDQYPWPEGKLDPKFSQSDDITLPNDSHYGQETAGSTNAGRSGTLQVCNATEVAYFPKNAERDPALGYLNSAYLEGEESLAIWDTTPNGPQGVFYNLWQDKSNGWIKIFVAWFENEEHAIVFESEEAKAAFRASLTDPRYKDYEEPEEMARYGVSLEQIAWRRQIIKDKCEGSVEKFRQEYPSNDTECFLRSSRPRFNVVIVDRMAKVADVNPAQQRGEIMMQGNHSVTFRVDDAGACEVWEQPRVGCRYLGVADTCTGEDQQLGGAQADPDYHSLGIIRTGYTDVGSGIFFPPRLVCHHWSRVEATLAAVQMASMSIYYGRCLVVPEVNACGLHMVKKLEELDIPVYERRRLNRAAGGSIEKAKGWKTDEVTRKTIIDGLGALVLEWKEGAPNFEVHSRWVMGQMRTFITNENGRTEAMPGHHDDGVLMLAIGMANLELATEFVPVRRGKHSVDDIMRREGWRRMGGSTARR